MDNEKDEDDGGVRFTLVLMFIGKPNLGECHPVRVDW